MHILLFVSLFKVENELVVLPLTDKLKFIVQWNIAFYLLYISICYQIFTH